jgi:Dolichyl-phosphate-mannose-protein mannosyltransferase
MSAVTRPHWKGLRNRVSRLGGALSPSDRSREAPRILTSCAAVFLIALGVRLLHWQDINVEVQRGQTMATRMATVYHAEAQRILEGGGILLPKGFDDPGDARMIVHPPGFSILWAAISKLFEDSESTIRAVQITLDAAAAIVVMLIAVELLPFATGVVAGLLVALSPHLAYYSLWVGPDTLAALPILVAVYLIIRASKQPRLLTVVSAGAFLGLSCWLRSNALLLAPFLALLIALLFKRGERLRYSAALVGTALVVISPITIRNLVLYGHFIPLSVGAGITMVEGVADYDRDHKFEMPFTDDEVAQMDAEMFGRPDYASDLWAPDGVDRDRARLTRGLSVARSSPAWFFGVMLRRAGFMLRYNDSFRHDWPFGTAMAPVLSAEATFSRDFEVSELTRPVWSNSPADLIAGNAIKARGAEFAVVADGRVLQLIGDDSEFGDQLASAPIALQKNTDYLAKLPIKLERGHMAAKITTLDLRIALASVIIPDAEIEEKKWEKKKAKESVVDSAERRPMSIVKLPFASGNRTEVRLVISNNGGASVRPFAQVDRSELLMMGPTPFLWTRYPRAIIRGIQKNLYRTGRMLPLIGMGIIMLAAARRWRVLVVVLAVPAYYLSVQSALHTEYRYILAIHYFLFVMAAVTVACLGAVMAQVMGLAAKAVAAGRGVRL